MTNNDKETTTFHDMCNILSELWVDYREENDLYDFVKFNDLGLPMAFMVSERLVTPTDRAKEMIEDTFAMLLTALEVEDAGFTSIEDLMLG